ALVEVLTDNPPSPFAARYTQAFKVDVNPSAAPPPSLADITFRRLPEDAENPAPEVMSLRSRSLASFTLSNPIVSIADVRATIDWGDGTTSPGSIRPLDLPAGPQVTYQVVADHDYARSGLYRVLVTVECASCACHASEARGTVWVSEAGPALWLRDLETGAANPLSG